MLPGDLAFRHNQVAAFISTDDKTLLFHEYSPAG
jgi:hypothetical protein